MVRNCCKSRLALCFEEKSCWHNHSPYSQTLLRIGRGGWECSLSAAHPFSWAMASPPYCWLISWAWCACGCACTGWGDCGFGGNAADDGKGHGGGGGCAAVGGDDGDDTTGSVGGNTVNTVDQRIMLIVCFVLTPPSSLLPSKKRCKPSQKRTARRRSAAPFGAASTMCSSSRPVPNSSWSSSSVDSGPSSLGSRFSRTCSFENNDDFGIFWLWITKQQRMRGQTV